MANNYFQFKQFTIFQDRCAMKVGTDGVLLGAWATHPYPRRILDIGSGTGLISLMLAQRFSNAVIDGVEIHDEAALQARENIDRTEWSSRINIYQKDFLQFENKSKYNLIVSNPPFFENSLEAPDLHRCNARHTSSLSLESLISGAKEKLTPDGKITLVLPCNRLEHLKEICTYEKLYFEKLLWIKTTPKKSAKRVLITFSSKKNKIDESEMIVELQRHVYSEEYIALTKDFYLRL